MEDDLKKYLQEAEQAQEMADETLKKYLKKTKAKLETGHIGEAARLFEEACQYCETHQIPKETVAPLGYAILLLQACEKAVQEEKQTKSS
jgi:hypothetical protein